MTHFYPRPPRGGRPKYFSIFYRFCEISTHALREEGDDRGLYSVFGICRFLPTPSARRATVCAGWYSHDLPHISTHALREEGDGLMGVPIPSIIQFLPTPSARRAT